jgi:hypothetical protein
MATPRLPFSIRLTLLVDMPAFLFAAFNKLRDSIAEYLDEVDNLARDRCDDHLIAKSPSELLTLTKLIRTLLAEHRPDNVGCCATCPRIGIGWLKLSRRRQAAVPRSPR